MNRIIYIVLILIIPSLVFAQREIEIKSRISKVIVYKNGASVTRNAKVNLKKGKTVLMLKNMPDGIDEDNIQVSLSDGVLLHSVKVSSSEAVNNAINDSIGYYRVKYHSLRDSVELIRNLIRSLDVDHLLLIDNKEIDIDGDVTVNELKQSVDYFWNQINDITFQKHKYKKILSELERCLENPHGKLFAFKRRSGEYKNDVMITLYSDKNVNTDIVVDYAVASASWDSEYDIRLDDKLSYLRLAHKAKIRQNTGENWNNVDITLSTGNIQKDIDFSDLKADVLTRGLVTTSDNGKRVFGKISGRVISDVDNKGIPGANVIVGGTNIGVATDVDGNFTIDVPEGSDFIEFSAMAFKKKNVWLNDKVVEVVLSSENLDLDLVTIVAFGKSVWGKSEKSKPEYNVPLEINKGQTSVEFSIDVPYTIPSDNKYYDVPMVEYPVNVTYSYSSVPKLYKETYLMANLTNYGKYNLSDGLASIYLNGTYQGKTELNMIALNDTMEISVGYDPDIVVKRNMIKEFTSNNIAGSYKKVERAWEITVKNNKLIPVDVDIYDQYPISTDSDIKVKLEEHSGATIDEESGELKWKLHLKPKQTKEIIIKYTVKYPKYIVLQVE